MLLSSEEYSLKNKILQNQKYGQLAILLVKNLPEDINDFKFKVAREWKLGKSEKDDGLLLIIAIEDRKIGIVS